MVFFSVKVKRCYYEGNEENNQCMTVIGTNVSLCQLDTLLSIMMLEKKIGLYIPSLYLSYSPICSPHPCTGLSTYESASGRPQTNTSLVRVVLIHRNKKTPVQSIASCLFRSLTKLWLSFREQVITCCGQLSSEGPSFFF